MIVLDGCCGAGGAARGYRDAGHEVWGVDLHPQPNYLKSGAAGFLRCDILQALRQPWVTKVDFIHVSPPCQRHSKMSNCRPGLAATYPDLVPAVRELLISTGKPYVIEQPEHGAPLIDPVTLCGWMFGYETYRHRCFEAGGGFTLARPPTPPEGTPGRRMACGWPHPAPAARAGHWEPGKFVSVAGHERVGLTRKVMAIDWTNREELAEAIAPYHAEWIGEQLARWAAPRKADGRHDWAWLQAPADHEAGREDDAVRTVVSLSEFRYGREEEREEWDWTARFRGWARTLADQDNRAPDQGWTGDDYLELCGVIAELLEGWADELDGKPRSGS